MGKQEKPDKNNPHVKIQFPSSDIKFQNLIISAFRAKDFFDDITGCKRQYFLYNLTMNL